MAEPISDGVGLSLSLPLHSPEPGDVINLSLQVSVDGLVRASLLSISTRIVQPTSQPPASTLSPNSTAPVPPALAHLPPSCTRCRVLGHTRSEGKDGTEFITYLVEYLRQQLPPSASSSTPSPFPSQPTSPRGSSSPFTSSSPLVTSKRFSDLYSFHRHLSLSFLCLPPFPSRTLLRSVSDFALIRERELALTLYLQLIAQREDIRRTGELERFLSLGEGEGMGSPSNDARKEREQSDSERERDVDVRMRVEEGKAEQRRGEEQRGAEASSQRFDLLIDQFNVLHTRHIDVDCVTEYTNKAQEMRQTTFSKGPTPRTHPRPTPAPPSPPPAFATLSLLTCSATFTLNRALLPSPNLLLLAAGDPSTLGHLDAYITGLWTGWLDGRKQAEKLERQRSKPEVYREEDHRPNGEQEEQREAEQPLGAVYAFHRGGERAQWQPTLSLFFEREVVDAVWDGKRRWVYLLFDDGLCHVYSPLAPDWSRVRRVWTLRLHTTRITSALFSPHLDALLTLSADGRCHTFDLASLSLTSAFTEVERREGGVVGWKGGGKGGGLAWDEVTERVFIGGGDGGIGVWDAGKVGVREAKEVGVMRGHEGAVSSVEYEGSSEILVSGGVDGALLVWEVRGMGQEGLSVVKGRVEGHAAEITRVALSDDGWWVLSGDVVGRVMVTSRDSALPVLAFQAHDKPITSLAMRAGLIVTASEDRTARVWKVEPS